MSGQPRSEWRLRRDFAEIAEALGINTDQIMAATRSDDLVIALFMNPPDEHGFDPDEPIFGARLARDEDGILRVIGRPVTALMNYAELRAEIERQMGNGELGEP